MNRKKIGLHCCNIAVAVCLAGGSGAVLAKAWHQGAGESGRDGFGLCVVNQSTSPAAKSPQQTLSQTCSPAASSTGPVPLAIPHEDPQPRALRFALVLFAVALCRNTFRQGIGRSCPMLSISWLIRRTLK